MKNIGVICEYNPFHNGHMKQLRLLREQGRVICLMSGNYVQRGEPAILPKQTRAEAAVRCGADLVLELPLTYAIRSAEGFADGAVEILDAFGCVDELAFGCEEVDNNIIMSTAKLLLSEELPPLLRAGLEQGLSFPTARQRALERMGFDARLLETPNNILAVEYCKAILRREAALQPQILHRQGSYHFSDDPENPSASFLRGREDWTGFVPDAAQEVFDRAARYEIASGERAWLARLRSISDEEFQRLPYGGEGLWRKVAAACRTEQTLEGIIAAAKSKRYTRTRLMRLLLCGYLGIVQEMLDAPAPYVRVLAFSESGRDVLRQAKRAGTRPLVNAGATPPEKNYWTMEQRAAALFELFRCGEVGRADSERTTRVFPCKPKSE